MEDLLKLNLEVLTLISLEILVLMIIRLTIQGDDAFIASGDVDQLLSSKNIWNPETDQVDSFSIW